MKANPLFNTVKTRVMGKNTFDKSHSVKMSFKMGRLYPIMLDEVLPGDEWRISSENLLRFAPLVAPVMHKVMVKTFYFFVPNRLLWENFEDFMAPDDATDRGIVYPTINISNVIPEGCLADYLGIPTGAYSGNPFTVSALPFAAVSLIWDEWFRDQNLQDEIFTPLVDGDNTTTGSYLAQLLTDPPKRAWMPDYFTKTLPFAQKGDTVTLPLVEDTNTLVGLSGTNAAGIVRKASDGTVDPNANPLWQSSTGNMQISTSFNAFYDPNGTLSVNINEDAVSINALREAFALQRFAEIDARGGTRYTENIKAQFGVSSPDARLQRPELIGMGGGLMSISEVLQTSAGNQVGGTNPDNPSVLGTTAGHGISVNDSTSYHYRATEHGWIIGFINVQPDTAYYQGLHKMWSRRSRTDHYFPALANIGEQPVLNKELYIDHSSRDGTFGYLPIFTEYKVGQSRVCGEMRSSLAYWHLARDFDSEPNLNAAFIEATVPTRIFAVQYTDGSGELSADHIYGMIYNHVRVTRVMPFYGNPI